MDTRIEMPEIFKISVNMHGCDDGLASVMQFDAIVLLKGTSISKKSARFRMMRPRCLGPTLVLGGIDKHIAAKRQEMFDGRNFVSDQLERSVAFITGAN